MPEKGNDVLKYSHGKNSMKVPFIIDADMDFLLQKISTCHNNPKKLSTSKINKHTPSDYLLFTHCSFDVTKNNIDYHRDQDCMKRFCKDLKEHSTEIINYEKKEMMPLTYKENKSYKKQKICYICKIEFGVDNDNDDDNDNGNKK